MGPLVLRRDDFTVGFIFGICLPSSVHLEELLNISITIRDLASAFLDDSILSLDLFQKMLDLSGKVSDYATQSVLLLVVSKKVEPTILNKLFKNRRCVFGHSHYWGC